jgi:hypothetical protein
MRNLTARAREVTWPVVAAEALRVIILLGLLALGGFMLITMGSLGWVPVGVACFDLLAHGCGITVVKATRTTDEETPRS